MCERTGDQLTPDVVEGTDIVACILILILAIPILGVIVKWTLHQLVVMF